MQKTSSALRLNAQLESYCGAGAPRHLGRRGSTRTVDDQACTCNRALETHLRHEPEKTSRSRIKRLQGLRRPQYRLRVGDIRVFYDFSGTTVEVLAIVAKSEAESWLAQFGNPE
jgi:mRNA interferase RelE/StbE